MLLKRKKKHYKVTLQHLNQWFLQKIGQFFSLIRHFSKEINSKICQTGEKCQNMSK